MTDQPKPRPNFWNSLKAALIVIVMAFTCGAAYGACNLGARLVESLVP